MHVILPERRSKRRYVTLKNAGIVGIAVVIAFLLLSVWSAFRPHSGATGNLFTAPAQSSESASTRNDPMVVTEGSSADHPGTDPVLLDPGAQDQLRPAPPLSAPPAPAPPTAVEQTTGFEHRTSQLGKGKRVTISGGTEGVQVHTETTPPQKP
ncbi:MAG: hypothetical protein M3041_06435 [Acidobacteriota bacterium]|nr:hypothetical protein [Acidobacteriota bacterium]